MDGTEIMIVLPMPPSGNRLTRGKRGQGKPYPAPKYVAWKKAADGFLVASQPIGGWPCIDGGFTASILLDRKALHGGDPDNRVKALFDFAQRARLIANDKHLRKLDLEVGEIREGVRMTLRPAA